MINIPIYRADILGSNKNIIGWFLPEYYDCVNLIRYSNVIFIDNIEFFEIDPTTLAIHFTDMLDSQGNKIFASLSEDGKGGDIVKIKTSISNCEAFYYFDNEAMSIRLCEMSKSHMTWEYGITLDYDGNPTKKVIGIQE